MFEGHQTKNIEGGYKLEKSLVEKIKEAKKEHENTFTCFFNNGKVEIEEYYSAKRITEAQEPKQFKSIEDVFTKAAETYARHYDFDRMDMNLLLGLIFNSKDVDENNQRKSNAKPIPGIVRFYTGSVKSYLAGEQTNTIDYNDYGIGRQSYTDYNQLLKAIQKSGLQFTGPKSFEEFQERILSGEVFDIILSANLNQKEEEKQFIKRR